MSSSQQSVAERTDAEPAHVDESSTSTPERPTATAFDTTAACIECGAQSFTRSEAGEWYCDSCGVVHTKTEIEYSEPGWTPYEQRRTGPSASVSRVDVGTTVGRASDGSNPSWARYNKRLSQEQQSLRHGLREIRALTATLETTDRIRDRSAYIFRQVTERGLLVGHSIEAMAAACVHATAREYHRPFPLKQINEASPIECSAIKSAFSKLVREFDLRVAPPLPTAFIARFASDADLSCEVRRQAYAITETAIEDGEHVGQNPTGVAAAALYGAAKEGDVSITQDELASTAYVSVVTLSRQWQTLKQYTEIDID